MHHSDTCIDRGFRRIEDGLTAGEKQMTFVGSVQASEDVRQSCLSGAVFAEEGVHFTNAHLKGDVFVRDNAGKPLGNAKGSHCVRSDCPDYRRFRHLS